MERSTIIRSLIIQAISIAAVAFAIIVIAVYAIPHLPIANRKSFPILLHAQMTLDRDAHMHEEAPEKGHILFLGSSVVERGVADLHIDTLLAAKRLPYFATNSAGGGFFARPNLIMLRTMLEQGLRPARVIYGTFLQELNSRSSIHWTIHDDDLASLAYKEKSLANAIYYGPMALAPMVDLGTIHVYLFAINNAFRDIDHPNFFQRLSFGVNHFERDSNYTMSPEYLNDLKEVYYLCRKHTIPFAFYNAPLRPHIASMADLPYAHREEAYQAVETFAKENSIPLWNFDSPQLFEEDDFLDTYHLTPAGARRLSVLLVDKIMSWDKGVIEQDVLTADRAPYNDKDSVIRNVFHF